MHRLILLTGFAPFGGEKTNPSWEVAKALDGHVFGGATVVAKRLPVNCTRAAKVVAQAIEQMQPTTVLGLGQAGGRPALSLEQIAINLYDPRRSHENDGGIDRKAIVADGPDAYFSRLPFKTILPLLRRNGIPSSLSLSAGIYACNAAMYATLHALRRHPRIPAGFVHLPYTATQAIRRATPSMSLEMMTGGVEAILRAIVRHK